MDYLLKTSAIIAIFYGFYKLILQRETFFQSNRWFLLIGILTAILVPLIVIPIYVEIIESPLAFTNIIMSNNTETIKETINWSQVLVLIYSIGVAFLSGKFILNLVSLYKLISSHSKENGNEYSLIKTEQDITPFSFFNFIVYNPTKFKGSELDQIIIHEKVHAQQQHSMDILISQIATIIFWFNPFVWLYKKEIQQNLEFIADDLAQQESACEKSYQKLLLKASLPKNQLALTNNFYNSLIKKRIIMLHKNRSKSTNQWKYTLILPLIAAFILTFNTKVIAQNETSENEIVYEEDIQMTIITKDFEKSDLEKVKKNLSKEGITATIKNIKRNNKSEITAISISVKSKQSNANYSVSSDEAIKPIKITYDNKGGNISIGNSNILHGDDIFFVSKNGEHKIHSTKKGNNFVFLTKNGEVHKSKNGKHTIIDINEDSDGNNSTVWVTENGDKTTKSYSKSTNSTIEIITGGDKGENKVFILGQGDELLYFIDGKKATKKDVDKLNPDKIEKMEVLKGDKAIEKYGKKASDGVVLITTKNKK